MNPFGASREPWYMFLIGYGVVGTSAGKESPLDVSQGFPIELIRLLLVTEFSDRVVDKNRREADRLSGGACGGVEQGP